MPASFGKMDTYTARGNRISIIFLESHSVICTTALSHLYSSAQKSTSGNQPKDIKIQVQRSLMLRWNKCEKGNNLNVQEKNNVYKADSFHHIILQKGGIIFESLQSLHWALSISLLWAIKYYLGKTNTSLKWLHTI